ncbi:methyl-accepting chemotaxis protein [Paenibacillus sp. PAMC21692]|uniref:methyl-accepting chemotaxis protein n=1 Tax=Paenibacillus sp. PAMC21692 TaxID=2762320 RepID=UPI00164E8571|nr:methyl-accepting chemotaxis protein [Paenibacillus sp. PAMC21692]QNK57076.1 hypothetical protein H7F31_32080 [Paenibacillus sp. PAMC21692]
MITVSRAGESGRGFGVVANEVKGLASESGISAKRISDLIRVTQLETSQAVDAMNSVTERLPRVRRLRKKRGTCSYIV